MAVYPDKIILKETTDSEAAIIAAISSGGTAPIANGEIVVGRESGKVRLWALDATGTPKAIGGAESIDALSDVDTATTAPVVGQTLIYQPGNQWKPGNPGNMGTIAKRVDETETTSSIADGASEDVTFTQIGQSGTFVSLTFSHAATVSFYSTAADRAAGTNALLTYSAVAAGTVTALPPGGKSYYNNDSTVSSAIYAKVTNASGSNAAISVTARVYADSAGDVFLRGGSAVTTATIADGGALDVTIPNTGRFGEFISVTISHAAWLTIYTNTASRTADATRLEGDDPTPGSGVLLEVITTATKLSVPVTPSAAYFNSETTPLPELYAKIVNKSGAARALTITLQVMPIQN